MGAAPGQRRRALMVLDTSAVVAILFDEPGRRAPTKALEADPGAWCPRRAQEHAFGLRKALTAQHQDRLILRDRLIRVGRPP